MSQDLEERVTALEKEVAGIQGQLKSDMKHIDRRFDELESDMRRLFEKLEIVNTSISNANTTGQLATQMATGNEKMLATVIAVVAAVIGYFGERILQ
jgi:chaperonin cofactor prefoldin